MKTTTRIFYGCLLMILFCSLGKTVLAQKEPVYVEPLIGDSGQIKVGSKMVVKDSVFFDPVLKPTINQTYYINNLISLRINEGVNKLLPDSFSLSVKLQLIYVAPDTLSDSINQKVLTINYYKNKSYSDKAIFYFQGAHYVEAQVLEITSQFADTSVILPLVMLENRMVISRDYVTNCTNDAIGTITKDVSTIAQSGELKVSWPPNGVSQMYDLEWTFIDKSALDKGRYSTGGTLDPNLIFRNNASRITTKANQYLIPLLYDGEGTLFFRLRGTTVDGNGEIRPTQWSSEVNTNSASWSYVFTGHQTNLNWQATTTFAEDGKRKSVVQYYDGSLRGRQTVTRDNTTDTTIIAESLYDKQGRPVIQVMPAPSLSRLIQYTPGFNIKDINSNEYDKSLYDTILTSADYCNTGAPAMDSVSGASKYYSSLNANANNGFHKYIPKAYGYAFSETQYTGDNTGRISRQGGVGPDFRIGSGRESKYYYSTPDPKELDALFGTEVGEASHYQKNMVRDANGQYSVSYVDMHGRTIATALAGAAPQYLQALSSFYSESYTDQLLTPTNNVLNGSSVEFSKALLMAKDDYVTFTYSLGNQSLSIEDCKQDSICYDCLYDITIRITGDCPGCVSNKNDTTLKLTNVSLFTIDTTCGLAMPIDTSLTVFLKEGSYTVTKSLSISRQGLDFYRDSVYIPRNTCISYDSLYNTQLQLVNSSVDCNPSTLNSASYLQYREQMLIDMYPVQGQYGDTAFARECFSIFDKTSGKYFYQTAVLIGGPYKDEEGNEEFVVNDAGKLVRPEELSPNEFVANFKDSWAQTLLNLHPEYLMLLEYEKFSESHIWDDDFFETDTYAAARAKGYLNPINSTAAPASEFSFGNDPLYTNPVGAAALTAITDSLLHFRIYPSNPSNPLTLWGFATALAKCEDPGSQSCIDYWNQTAKVFDTTSLCEGELDMAWRTFRAIYLEKKREWIEKYLRQEFGNIQPGACRQVFLIKDSVLAMGGYTGNSSEDLSTGTSQLNQQYTENCEAYKDRWRKQLEGCYTEMQLDQIIERLVNVCKEGSDVDHPYGASTVRPSSQYPYRSFAQVIWSYNDSLGIHSIDCNPYLIDKPLPYEQQALLVQKPVFNKPDNCTCEKLNTLYGDYQSNAAAYTNFSDYLQQKLQTTIAQNALDSLLDLCSGAISCRFISKPILIPPALQCGVEGSCISCYEYQQAFEDFKQLFPGSLPSLAEPDTVQQHINTVFVNYMNQRFGFSRSAGDYLHFADQCQASDSPGADTSLQRIQSEFGALYTASVRSRLVNGLLSYEQGKDAGNNNLPLGATDPHYQYSYNDGTWFDAYTVSHPWQNNNFHASSTYWISTNDMNTLGVSYFKSQIFVTKEAIGRIKSYYAADDGVQAFYVNGQQISYTRAEESNAYITNLHEGWNEIKWKVNNTVGYVGFSSYFTSDTVFSFDCKKAFTDYFNQQKGTSYTTGQVDSLFLAITGTLPKVCGDTSALNCNDLEKLVNEYYFTSVNPASRVVELDMRTFAGNKTPAAGPKGVFNVHGNLIGNTIDGTLQQVNDSYAQIWNSDTANAAVGTLTSLTNGRFKLQLNPAKEAPSKGIIGQRFYQYELRIRDTLMSFGISGEGSVIDFGDSTQVFMEYKDNGSNIGYSDAKTTVYQGRETALFLENLKYMPNYTPVKYLVAAHSYSKPVGVRQTYTVTFYHTDLKGVVDFKEDHTNGDSLIISRNLRGYFPQQTLGVSFYSTQDSSICRTNQIKNFNEITSIQRVYMENRGQGAILNVNLESFQNNHNLQYLLFSPAYSNEDSATLPLKVGKSFHSIFPDLPLNFPKLGVLRLTALNYREKELDSNNFELPLLRHLELHGQRVKAYQIDTILNQLARVNTQDSGTMYYNAFVPSEQPTSASAAAYQILKDNGWHLGGINGESFFNYNSPRPVDNEPLVRTNGLTEYINEELGTELTYSELQDMFLRKCGYPIDADNWQPTNVLSLCGKSEIMNELVDVQPDPCGENANWAATMATQLYQLYQDSIKENFNETYTKNCLKVAPLESFTVTRPNSEYHYTLYYYDQAGNLVKTIPPKAVQPNRNAVWLDEVRQKRQLGQQQVPAHATDPLVTVYRYNSLNQVVSQKTPDGGQSAFWYDRLGRLAVSQNAKQRAESKYSYTTYDAIGRIVEVGQKYHINAISQSITRDPLLLKKWILYRNFEQTYQPEMVTYTLYDIINPNASSYYYGYTPFRQKAYTLRNRVSMTRYFAGKLGHYYQVSGGDTTYTPHYWWPSTGVDYSYDIHGNVDSLLNTAWDGSFMKDFGAQAYKYIAYKYDLISGKVNEVHYQGSNTQFKFADEFYHRYEYDADNRLIDVYSADNRAFLGQQGLEEHDAHYEYYRHGPLARVVTGQQQVQGTDYAYTLQGWLKGVNSTSLSSDFDMGEDGKTTSANKLVARDAYGFNLNYFTGEYASISGTDPFPGHTGFMAAGVYKPLYNGNISSMAVNIGKLNQPQLYNYGYDQLNRLISMDVYRGLNQTGNNWSALNLVNDYKERIAYDANGNILKYLRQGYGAGLNMDSLTYNYNAGTNQLNYIRDQVTTGAYTVDIDNQSTNNYSYDAIGNLITDVQERVTGVSWNVYGKIAGVTRSFAANKTSYTNFQYDPSGNRVGKQVGTYYQGDKKYWYVRDAQGNVMAVYYSQTNPNWSNGVPRLVEQHLYGSSRLGMVKGDRDVTQAKAVAVNANLIGATYLYTTTRGAKQYELSNHLGNVLATISDRRVGHVNGSSYDYYEAEVISASDYYPFGMEMVSRTYSSPSYRYGFNGKGKDDEAKGSGNQYDYGFRIYDPRLGRFLSVDPLTKSYPFYTPYSFAGNKPIWAIDLDGLEEVTFSDVWHGRANIVDWINDVGTWKKVNQTINPLYQAYEHGYEITTGKDARTGAPKGRGQAAADAGVNVMGWLTFNRLLKVTTVANPLETQTANNSRALSQPAKSTTQTAAMDATESKAQNTVTKPIQVVNRTPQTGLEFGSQSYTLSNGNIKLNNRGVTNGTFDFVVTNDGKLVIGSGHYNLSGNAETVKAAGEISLYKGKVTNISNGSGHYQPPLEQAKEFGNILKDAGVNVSGAKLNLYDKTGKKVETIKL